MRVQFHLIYCGLNASVTQEQLEFRDRHVRRPYMANQSPLDQFLHLSPGSHELGVDVGFRLLAARRYITSGWMEIRKWPMHQVEIQITESQVRERFSTRCDHIIFAVFVVPQLRGDPELLAWNMFSHHLLQRVSNLVFITVHGRTIEVPIPNLRRSFYRRCNFTRRDMVRTEGPQTDCWHVSAAVQSSLRYKCWINISVNQRS